MRSKTPLVLMEQLAMVLVFALAAALCLQAFAFADRMSARNEAVDRAVVECQRMAETLKGSGSSMGAVPLLGGAMAEKILSIRHYYDADWNMVEQDEVWTYQLTVSGQTPPAAGLNKALVRAADREDGELFSLNVVWQGVDGNG